MEQWRLLSHFRNHKTKDNLSRRWQTIGVLCFSVNTFGIFPLSNPKTKKSITLTYLDWIDLMQLYFSQFIGGYLCRVHWGWLYDHIPFESVILEILLDLSHLKSISLNHSNLLLWNFVVTLALVSLLIWHRIISQHVACPTHLHITTGQKAKVTATLNDSIR
jgi:hypothetical protein